MDPRHPELAISRMHELMTQYNEVLYRVEHGRTYGNLAEFEREGSLVVQEICLIAPRLHEALMQASRQRRHDIARGVLTEPQDMLVENPVEEPKPGMMDEATADKILDAIEKVAPAPKKKTAKKKTAKKAKK